MGNGGRPRTPTKSKIIKGTFRKDRAPEHEPEPDLVEQYPKPPSGLPRDGRRMWKRLAKELVDKRILTVVDLEALEVCCMNYGIYRELYRAVTTVRGDDGSKRKRTIAEYLLGRNSQTMPEYVAMTKAMYTFKAYLVEFGLTPSSRSRLDIPEPKDERDEMEQLLNEQV